MMKATRSGVGKKYGKEDGPTYYFQMGIAK